MTAAVHDGESDAMARAENTCLEDAAEVLIAHGYGVGRVVSVDRDSILYLNALGQPITAWLHRVGEAVRVVTRPGFHADPPDGWHSVGGEAASKAKTVASAKPTPKEPWPYDQDEDDGMAYD